MAIDMTSLEGSVKLFLTLYICKRDSHTPLSAEFAFYHYGAEIPIEEIQFPMAIPNGHLEWFYYHIW